MHLTQDNVDSPLIHCLSDSLTTRTSTLYLFSILHLQTFLEQVLTDLKLKGTLVEIRSEITRANKHLENYSCHLTVGQAYLGTRSSAAQLQG